MGNAAVTVVLRNPEQAAEVIRNVAVPKWREVWATGRWVEATFAEHEDGKTDRQRNYYHGVVLKAIEQQARPNGQQFPKEVWKEHFRAEYLGHKTLTTKNPLTGKKVRRRLRVSTEDLGVRGYSKLIDRVSAFAATELGVVIPIPFEQWERMQVDPDTGEIIGGIIE